MRVAEEVICKSEIYVHNDILHECTTWNVEKSKSRSRGVSEKFEDNILKEIFVVGKHLVKRSKGKNDSGVVQNI